METKHRLTVDDIESWTSGPEHFQTYAHGTLPFPYSATGTRAAGSGPTVVIEESITTGKGRAQQHNCRHWIEISRAESCEDIYPTVSGYTINTDPPTSHYRALRWSQNDISSQLKGDWIHWTIPRVTIDWQNQNESTVLSRLRKAAVTGVDGLLVDVVEAHELTRTAEDFAHYSKFLKKNWSSVRKLLSKRFAKYAAGAYLAYEFGIAPLISDIEKTRSFISRCEKNFQRFLQPQTRRLGYSQLGTFSYDSEPEYLATNKLYQGGCSYLPRTRYTLVYKERNPYSTRTFQTMSYLLNRFGQGGPADFAWELIPFSFVVDWFVDVSNWTDRINRLSGYDPIDQLAFWRSRKAVCWADLDVEFKDQVTHNVVGGGRICSKEYHMYERTLLSGSSNLSIIGSDRFGKKQGLLSLALLVQKFLHAK